MGLLLLLLLAGRKVFVRLFHYCWIGNSVVDVAIVGLGTLSPYIQAATRAGRLSGGR